MTTPTIGSDNTQTVYNLLDERKEMLADILKLREALSRLGNNKERPPESYYDVDCPTCSFNGKRIDDFIEQALNETQKWEKGK